MATRVSVFHSRDDDRQWGVALNGQHVVGFYGPQAQFLAERHGKELSALLRSREGDVARSKIDEASDDAGSEVETSEVERSE